MLGFVKKEKKKIILLGIHTEVHQGVEGRVGHGQPEEGEEDVLSIAVAHHVLRGKGGYIAVYGPIGMWCILTT